MWTVSLPCPFLKENILIRAVPLVSFWNCLLAYSVLRRRLCLCICLEVIYSSAFWASHPGSCSPETWFLSGVRGEDLAALFHRWRCRFWGTICRGDCLFYGVCCWHLWGEKKAGGFPCVGFFLGLLFLWCVCVSVLAAYRLSPVPCWDLKWTPWYFCCASRFMMVGLWENFYLCFSLRRFSFSACLFLVMFCFISYFLWCDIIPKEPLENDSDRRHFNFLPAPMPQD